MSQGSTLERSKVLFREMVDLNDLRDRPAVVSVVPLSAQEAIGNPQRRDFPILEGKERLVQAEFMGARGHAFTDAPQHFSGSLADVIALPLSSNQNRSIYVAVLNAVCSYLKVVRDTLHCKDDDPEICGQQIAETIVRRCPDGQVGLVGCNPAIVDHLVRAVGPLRVRITDRNPANINQMKNGVEIWDGRTRTLELVQVSHVLLITGTTLINGTFDEIIDEVFRLKKDYYVYGVTVAGVSHLVGLNRLCPCAREQ